MMWKQPYHPPVLSGEIPLAVTWSWRGRQAPAYITAIEEILEQREQVLAREREVLEGLNSVLNKIGHRIVPLEGTSRRWGRLLGNGEEAPEETPRRRGRPPKVKTESV
jgi:hypothetical protein